MTAGLSATRTIHRQRAKAGEKFYWSNPEISSRPARRNLDIRPSAGAGTPCPDLIVQPARPAPIARTQARVIARDEHDDGHGEHAAERDPRCFRRRRHQQAGHEGDQLGEPGVGGGGEQKRLGFGDESLLSYR